MKQKVYELKFKKLKYEHNRIATQLGGISFIYN